MVFESNKKLCRIYRKGETKGILAVLLFLIHDFGPLRFFKAILHLPEYEIETFLGMVYLLAILVPGLAVTIRRLHDTGKSGCWICIGLIPLIGQFILLIMLCQNSVKEENQYGPNPKGAI